jgi:phosphopantothenoylcysteine synthetase/decarboxylase
MSHNEGPQYQLDALAASSAPTVISKTARRPRILLAVTGSVAAIKGPEIAVRLATKIKADVKILLTKGGENFWSKAKTYNPAAWNRLHSMLQQSIGNTGDNTQHSDEAKISLHTASDEWKEWQQMGDPVLHIDLRNWADILLVAPLSAHTLAKFAHGLCDDTLSCVMRAWDFGYTGQRNGKPVLLAPAMNTAMWDHPLTQSQLQTVKGFWNAQRPYATLRKGIENYDQSLDGVCIIAPQIKTLACGELGNGALASVDEILSVVKLFTK